MTHRENSLAILNYEKYDSIPLLAFGYWSETVEKWAAEGHITKEEADGWDSGGDNSEADKKIMQKLGFDFNWGSCTGTNNGLSPCFEQIILEVMPDGSQIIRDNAGLICKIKPGVVSIPSEIGTTLTDRKAFEELYLPKLQMSSDRVNAAYLKSLPKPADREIPIGLHVGSMIGNMRNLLGVEHLSYLYCDDEDLFKEVADAICGLAYECAKGAFETGVQYDYIHYWEDICYKNGPLINPSVATEIMGPWYKKINDMAKSYGINIISLDCDGLIDSLIPMWLDNGVNTMFPIEVGTWDASIAPWRKQYGKNIRGIGGMNKTVFAQDFAAIDKEIERLKPLVDLGGFIPCPDHRIAPDAIFANVAYYCEQFRKAFK